MMEKRINHLEYSYLLKTNSDGLRYKEAPLKGSHRIFVIGDSNTEGIGMEEEETFCRLLEKRFPAIDFINGGKSGPGPRQYWERFLKLGLKYNVNGVLLCIGCNDVEEVDISGRLSRVLYRLRKLPRFLISKFKKGGFIAKNSEIARIRGIPEERIRNWQASLPARLVQAAEKGQFNSHILSISLFNPDCMINMLDIESPESQAKWRGMRSYLSSLVRDCRKSNIELSALFIPHRMQCDPSAFEGEKVYIPMTLGMRYKKEWISSKATVVAKLEEWAQEENVKFLDLTPSFRKEIASGKEIYYSLDGHLNVEGQRAIAAAIEEWKPFHCL